MKRARPPGKRGRQGQPGQGHTVPVVPQTASRPIQADVVFEARRKPEWQEKLESLEVAAFHHHLPTDPDAERAVWPPGSTPRPGDDLLFAEAWGSGLHAWPQTDGSLLLACRFPSAMYGRKQGRTLTRLEVEQLVVSRPPLRPAQLHLCLAPTQPGSPHELASFWEGEWALYRIARISERKNSRVGHQAWQLGVSLHPLPPHLTLIFRLPLRLSPEQCSRLVRARASFYLD